MENTLSKTDRLLQVFENLAQRNPFHSSLEAYSYLVKILNEVEDRSLGAESYIPMRHPPTIPTPRMYPPHIEKDFFSTGDAYLGVHLLLSRQHITFISRYGAIEVQGKIHTDKYGVERMYSERKENVLFEKFDYAGHGVWHPKNR